MTYGIRNNLLLAARMKAGCDGRVRLYRAKAWEVALQEARNRHALSWFFHAMTSMLALSQSRATERR